MAFQIKKGTDPLSQVSFMNISKTPTIGVVEIPDLGLIDQEGKDWLTHNAKGATLVSKQVLLSSLQSAGFHTQLHNLGEGDYQEAYGKVKWGEIEFTKIYIGKKVNDLDPLTHDAWAITNNFSQTRETACLTITHLASKGRPVVAGGSDAIAAPDAYLIAGAIAVVLDKSGAANAPIMDYVLGRTPREELSGLLLATGNNNNPPKRVKKVLSPQDWPLPALSVARECLGTWYKGIELPETHWPIGSIFTDIGCDRSCDFCQTPQYRLGYRAMTPERVLQWAAIQKEVGAKALMLPSDQFLARVAKKGGREDVLTIMAGIREMGLAVFWNNGLELKKMTLGRGVNRKSGEDLTPDEELIAALYGWNGKVGCFYAYTAAERPLVGRERYAKLLPWREHREIVKAIVRAGVANIRYGLIIGFADDSHDSLSRLEEAVWELYEEVVAINPTQNFQVAPFSVSPIPGTPLADNLRQSGLLRFEDPSLYGSIWTTSVDSHHLSYQKISDWQRRLTRVGRTRYMEDGLLIND